MSILVVKGMIPGSSIVYPDISIFISGTTHWSGIHLMVPEFASEQKGIYKLLSYDNRVIHNVSQIGTKLWV